MLSTVRSLFLLIVSGPVLCVGADVAIGFVLGKPQGILGLASGFVWLGAYAGAYVAVPDEAIKGGLVVWLLVGWNVMWTIMTRPVR